MLIGPKYKICKRLGGAIFEKCQTQKYVISEARSQKGKRQKPGSDYKRQLIEKQRARFAYGITESKLKSYAEEAIERSSDNPTLGLLSLLECRLDNVVYRMGLAGTRRMARQLVAHGHILVNGKRIMSPSHQTRVGDLIGVREGSKGSPLFTMLVEKNKDYRAPAWVTVDFAALSGTRTGSPATEGTDILANLSAVFEFYSR